MIPPTLMPAMVQTRTGAPLALTQRPVPSPAAGEVLVRVQAAGLNPLDAKIRAGQAPHAQHPLPAILGIDLAGVVVAVADGVSGVQVGARVFGMTGGVGGVPGSLAQYAAVDAALIARIPDGTGWREAAAAPLVFTTAWEGLVDRARVQPGEHVLVHGGAGGVGHVAIQIARAHGAIVFATGSAHQAQIIEQLGATFVDRDASPVDYVQGLTEGRGFDIVLDTVGGATLDASFTAVRPYHGRVVSILGWGTHSLAPLSFRSATYAGVFTLAPLITGQGRAHHGRIMREAARLFESNRLAIRVDRMRYALDEAEAAYQRMASGEADGKVVVDVA